MTRLTLIAHAWSVGLTDDNRLVQSLDGFDFERHRVIAQLDPETAKKVRGELDEVACDRLADWPTVDTFLRY